jgi:hypothetical protein
MPPFEGRGEQGPADYVLRHRAMSNQTHSTEVLRPSGSARWIRRAELSPAPVIEESHTLGPSDCG